MSFLFDYQLFKRPRLRNLRLIWISWETSQKTGAKKKNQPVSRVLFLVAEALVIYLGATSPLRSNDLPAGSGGPPFTGVAPGAPAYLVFQPVRFTQLPRLPAYW